jgi:hypothetical protein
MIDYTRKNIMHIIYDRLYQKKYYRMYQVKIRDY